MTRVSFISIAMGVFLAAALSASAFGNAAASTFAGTCQFSGTVAFKPPLTNIPQPVTELAQAAGSCAGTFRHGRTHQVDGALVTYLASHQGSAVSCTAGTSSGGGTLVFRGGGIRTRDLRVMSPTRLRPGDM